MMEYSACIRKIKSIKLLDKKEKEDFLAFISDFLRVVYEDRISFSEYLSYKNERSVLFQLAGKEGARIEILVIASHEPVLKVVALDENISYKKISRIADSIEEAIITYFRKEKKGKLYYVYVQGRDYIPSIQKSLAKKVIENIFANNITVLLLFSVVAYYLAYFIVGSIYAPIFLILAFFLFHFFSFKILAFLSDWKIDNIHGKVYIVSISMPLEKYVKIISTFSKKGDIYKLKSDIAKYLNCATIVDKHYIKTLLAKYGMLVEEKDIKIKTVNLYSILSRVFSKLKLAIPATYLVNSLTYNAIIAGVSSRFSTLVVTSGLLTELSERELLAVLSHEACHIKNKDTAWLCLLSSLAYIFQAFLVQPPMDLNTLILYAFLNAIILTILFGIAKIFEIRADIEAALSTGGAKLLKTALEKIAYQRIIKENNLLRRLIAWLIWDPHPPITFRLFLLDNFSFKHFSLLKTLRYIIYYVKGSTSGHFR